MDILRSVRDYTSKAIDEWKAFSSATDGGICHFQGLKDCKAKVALGNIKESFGKLAVLDRILERLHAECRVEFEVVS
jgi:hypothetical protein